MAELEGIWLLVITGLDYWTKLLEWTAGMNYWTDPFCHFVAYKMIPFPVKLYPALDQSVMVSISLHRTTDLAKQQMKMMLLLNAVSFIALKREGNLCPTHVKVLAWIAWYQATLEGKES